LAAARDGHETRKTINPSKRLEAFTKAPSHPPLNAGEYGIWREVNKKHK
jgi:hypothetical protein